MRRAFAAPLRTTVVAVTGGPCAGKTTALNVLRATLPALGLAVSVVPEFSTFFYDSGAGFPVEGNRPHQLAWERVKLRAQLASEDAFCSIARASGIPSVVLVDRGAYDVKAFTRIFAPGGESEGDSDWAAMLEAEGWSAEGLLKRYDGVVHMSSCAVDAPQFYDQFGNAARRETQREAVAQDAAIRSAWREAEEAFDDGRGAARFRVVRSNARSFGEKIDSVRGAVAALCGIRVGADEAWVEDFDRIEAIAKRLERRTALSDVGLARPGF